MRIKTEREMIRDFGLSWRGGFSVAFPYDMDEILGMKIPPTSFVKNTYPIIKTRTHRWTIEKSMIADSPLKKYKEALLQ